MMTQSMALLVVVMLLGSCGSRNHEPAAPAEGDPPYAFGDPDDVLRMPPELEEISGLTVLEDGLLGAIQDEDGRLFVLDPETGSVVRTVSFGGGGDYEGIQRVDDTIYVIRSDGRLYEIRQSEGEAETDKHSTDLHEDCDAEGLAYDEEHRRLLIACKDAAGPGLKGKKAIYAFDLAEGTLDPEPAIVIDVDTFLVNVKERHPVNREIRSLISPAVDLSGFSPSGIAVRPQTRHLYVLSARRKAVVVIDTEGDVAAVWELSENLFAQPEGIAFLPDGTLFISNEARDRGVATLLRFTPPN